MVARPVGRAAAGRIGESGLGERQPDDQHAVVQQWQQHCRAKPLRPGPILVLKTRVPRDVQTGDRLSRGRRQTRHALPLAEPHRAPGAVGQSPARDQPQRLPFCLHDIPESTRGTRKQALNGLQVENAGDVTRVAAAVDASEAAIGEAASRRCDLLLVHHGLFWDGNRPVTGRRYRRLAALLEGGIAVYSAHLPLDVHPLIMFYNKELFAAAGVEEPGTEPWTREQFEDALAKLEGSGVTPLSLGTAFQAGALFQALIRQYGGALTDPEGKTATYNSDAGVKALEKIKELRDKYTPDIAGTGDPEVNFFKEGNVGMVFHGPWWISDLQKLEFVGFAPLPTIGDQPATWGGSHHLALTSEDPATQAAAALWIKWLSDNSMEWAKAGQVPARQSVRDDPALAEAAAPISRVAESANIVVILPQVPALEPALGDQFGPVIDAYLAGDVTDPAAALEEANARSQQVIDENISIFGE